MMAANGTVIERLFRTLKEQAIQGRVLQTIDEVRDAVRAFAARAARLDTTFKRAASSNRVSRKSGATHTQPSAHPARCTPATGGFEGGPESYCHSTVCTMSVSPRVDDAG